MNQKTAKLFVVLFVLPMVLGGCRFDRYQGFISSPQVIHGDRGVSVKKGDNLYKVAKRYDVPLRDLIEVNRLQPPYQLHQGQLLILPKKRIHVVRRHETLTSIARQRGVDVHSLVQMNNLTFPYTIHENQRLKLSYPSLAVPEKKAPKKPEKSEPLLPVTPKIKVIPKVEPLLPAKVSSYQDMRFQEPPMKPRNARPKKNISPPRIASKKELSLAPIAKFEWPVRGKILTKYGKKTGGLRNDGVNIAGKKGAPIKAAEHGQVVYVGNALKGYGNLILIKHREGWITTYAHADRTFVTKGTTVKKGQKIATVGVTGNVKTTQLHFEIRKKTRTVDPLSYLQ